MRKKHTNIYVYMTFVFLSNFSLLASFLSLYLSELNYSVSIISLLFLSFMISKFIFEIPTGFISDMYGRKICGILGIIILLISYMLLLKNNIIYFFISFIIKGIGITFISGSFESIYIESLDKEELLKYNSIERLIFYVSLGISAFVSGFCIKKFGYNFIIIFDIIIIFIALVVSLYFKNINEIPSKKDTLSKNIVSAIKSIKHNKILLLLLCMDFANAFSFVGIEDFYAKFLQDNNINEILSGIIMSMELIFAAVIGLFSSKIFKKTKSYLWLYILPILNIVLMIIVYIKILPPIFIPILFFMKSTFFTIYAPMRYDLIQKNTESKFRATTISIRSQIIAIASILFLVLSSLLGTIFDISKITLIALGISLCIVIITIYKLRKIINEYI